jgi:hypothetical protein
MDGWAAATNAIFTARNRAQGLEPQPARPQALEAVTPATSGNKPGPRKRGRPPKHRPA